jgi:hypothetical protein
VRYYKIRLPVKIHVLRYLEHHFPYPYILSESDAIGPFLSAVFRRPQHSTEKWRSVEKLQHHWEISIPEHLIYDKGVSNFGSKNIMTFNTYIDTVMKEKLFERVQLLSIKFDMEKKQTILDFMMQYNVTESELSFDAWKKAVQRIEIDKKKRLKSPNELSRVKCA